MLSLAVVLASKAAAPTATFSVPVVFAPKALFPIPTLLSAVVLASKAPLPIAIFSAPVVFADKAA